MPLSYPSLCHTYTRTQTHDLQSTVAEISSEARTTGMVGVATIIVHLLHFLGSLMKDMSLLQARRKAASLDITTLTVSPDQSCPAFPIVSEPIGSGKLIVL